jgi:glycosyltransferase involved in cell wall biosynthesis
MKKIRVMHVWINFDVMRGLERTLLMLAKHVDAQKYDFSFCLFRYKEGPIGEAIQSLGCRIYNLDVSRRLYHLSDWIRALMRLYRVFKRHRPHIVQTYQLQPNLFGRIAAKLAGVPVILATELTFPNIEESALKRMVNSIFNRINRIVDIFTDGTVTVSEALKREMEGRLSSQKFEVIYPPFDWERFDECRTPQHRRPFTDPTQVTIGTVGRLSKEKGQRYLIEAMPKVLNAFPSARLLVVGDGYLMDALEKCVRCLKLEGKVLFTGHSHNVFNELGLMDVFVLPSLTESFGIVVLEAMAMALPVVATRVGGIPEVVVHGETGILVNPGSSPALGEAIINMLSHPDRSRALGLAGRTRVSKLFNPTKAIIAQERFYERLLSQKGFETLG